MARIGVNPIGAEHQQHERRRQGRQRTDPALDHGIEETSGKQDRGHGHQPESDVIRPDGFQDELVREASGRDQVTVVGLDHLSRLKRRSLIQKGQLVRKERRPSVEVEDQPRGERHRHAEDAPAHPIGKGQAAARDRQHDRRRRHLLLPQPVRQARQGPTA
jgi:hypothetical protein